MLRKLTAGIIILSCLLTIYGCTVIDNIEVVEIQDSLSQNDTHLEKDYEKLEIK